MKNPMPYADALKIAEAFLAEISDCCARVEIAGSLRRKKETIGDVEIVAIPKYVDDGVDLLGDRVQHSLLHARLMNVPGEKHKTIMLPVYKRPLYALMTAQPPEEPPDPIQVDLYITTPECWGVNLAIRTGSADFSHWLVTHRAQGGACPGWLSFRNARLVTSRGQFIETPEEIDVFRALRLDYILPELRTEGRWRR